MSEATFKDLEEKLYSALENSGEPTEAWYEIGGALDILYELMEEYGRTVKMSQGQYNWLEENKDEVAYAVGDFEDYERWTSFDRDFWYPLTQRDVVYAWLNPDKVVLVEDNTDYLTEVYGD